MNHGDVVVTDFETSIRNFDAERAFDSVCRCLATKPHTRSQLHSVILNYGGADELNEALDILRDLDILQEGRIIKPGVTRGKRASIYWIEDDEKGTSKRRYLR